jgi:3-dehydroquinate synthase
MAAQTSHACHGGVFQSMTVATRWLRAGGRDVPLLAGADALVELPRALSEVGFEGRLFVVADEYAFRLHGARLADHPMLCISGAEADKNLEQVTRVWDWLVDQGAQRRDAVLAFGGGVACDLAGFAAASYLRGIGLINVPTTLLAQVDASVGGKTGINHARGKNLIGAFYQPLCVVADTSVLATLSRRAFAAGMAEVAKMAMILDAQLFSQLEEQVDQLTPEAAEALAPVIARSIELKADVVERDEREAGDRMLLNYGHTIGHALEAAAGYGSLLHGEAVAVGMHGGALIAEGMGVLDHAAAERQAALLERLQLPARWPHVRAAELEARLKLDKKRAGEVQRWVLAHGVGCAAVHGDVPEALARRALMAVTGHGDVARL